MADISSRSRSQLTYAICYGFIGGPLHSRRFDKLMGRAGYAKTKPDQADIVIAHSAGCWLLPDDARPQLVIYVGMPLTMVRGRWKWFKLNLIGLKREPLRGLKIRLVGNYYALAQFRRNLDIFRHPKIGQPIIIDGVPTVFIANKDDAWPVLSDYTAYINEHGWSFLSLPGTHDDIWEHPERYTEIINHYARLLA